MKKLYNFFRNIFNVTLLFCCFAASTVMAQNVIINPVTNPQVIRLQGATFSVSVVNNTASPLANLTLEANPTHSGFSVSPPSISGINLSASGGTSAQQFTVTANCTAPQTGERITYTLKDGATILATAQSILINITESELIFTPPADIEVDYASPTLEYTRTWVIQQSTANVAFTNLRLVNNCNKTNINITKVELMTGMAGTVIADLTSTVLDNTPSTGYNYNINAAVFAQIGNSNGTFETGETIYIRETCKALTCGNATSTYTLGYGDGTNFCFSSATYSSNLTVVQPGYNPNIATTRTPITYPLSSSGTGTMCFTLSNNSAHAKAVFYDTKVRVWVSDLKSHFFTRAYLVDAAGNPLPGFADLTMTNNTPIVNDNGTNAIAGNAMAWVVSFENLNNPAYAAAYEAAGLFDATGNGIWNDLMPGATCYIAVDWRFDPSLSTPCAMNFYPYDNNNPRRHADIYYKNSCGMYQSFTQAYTASQTTTSTDVTMGRLRYYPPQSVILTPENIKPNDPTELYIVEQNIAGSNNSNWTIDQNNYEQYIIVTLPEGFDYNDAVQGFRINAATMCAIADVVRTEEAGRVVLTVRNRVTDAGTTNQYYRINIFAKSDITSDAIKTIHIEHEWAYPGETHYKYGCYYNIPVNYRLIAPYQSMTLEDFNAQRMTFGWTDYLKTTRIDLTNIDSYPGVDRNVAGPYDNVDMTGTITMDAGFLLNPTNGDLWLIDLSYDGAAANPYFIFPDPQQAVEVSLNGGTPFYIPEWDVDKLEAVITGGKHYILQADLTPYTLAGQPLETLVADDVVTVTFKTQTVEALPASLAQIKNFAMQTYLDINGDGAPENKNILAKNFALVDYRFLSLLADINTAGIFYENTTGNGWVPMAVLYLSGDNALSSVEIFPNEFRPNQTLVNFEKTFNTLVDITAIRITEYPIGSSNIVTILSPSDYTVSHADGKTTITVYKESQVENVSANWIRWEFQGRYYCYDNTSSSEKVSCILYPSSERSDITGEATRTRTNDFTGGAYLYTHVLSSTSPEVYPENNQADWDFTLTNQSVWANTDGWMPNSWISLSLPPEVDPASIALTDGFSTWNFTDFEAYSSGKYWVKLGDLEITSLQNFHLSCIFTHCVPFSVEIGYGMSRAAYPINPETGFENGNGTPCNNSYISVNAVPKQFALQGEVISPEPDGTNDPTRYLFCTPHTFKANFYNIQEGALYDPALILPLNVGVELDHSSVSVMQNGLDITIDAISGDDGNTDTERTVIITLAPGTILQPYGNPDDKIEISFNLQAVCGFTYGAEIYMQFMAEDACGTLIGETKNSLPIEIDGMSLSSNYLISYFTLSTTNSINLSSSSSVADIDLTATITLTTNGQLAGDYIAISVPPNMEVESHNELDFTFWKTEGGNELYQASMPTMNQWQEIDVDVTLTPVNPELWSCETVSIALFTGAYMPINCGDVACGIDMKHDNDTITKFEVIKPPVEFLAGSITAAGSFYSTISESVIFNGTLTLQENNHIEDLVIEVFSNKSGEMLPIPNAYFLIPEITTNNETTEFEFTSPALEIPAEDMCHLYLVIRKTATQNYFICENSIIQVPTVMFALSQTSYTVCVFDDLLIGTTPISGYTYTWTPTTYIKSETNNAFATVNFPVLIEPFTYTLSVNRDGCPAVQTAITVTTEDCNVCVKNYFVCEGDVNLAELIDYTETTDDVTFTFYDINVEPEEIINPPVVSLTPGFYYYAVTATLGECESEYAFLHLEVGNCVVPEFNGEAVICWDSTVFNILDFYPELLCSDVEVSVTHITSAATAAISPTNSIIYYREKGDPDFLGIDTVSYQISCDGTFHNGKLIVEVKECPDNIDDPLCKDLPIPYPWLAKEDLSVTLSNVRTTYPFLVGDMNDDGFPDIVASSTPGTITKIFWGPDFTTTTNVNTQSGVLLAVGKVKMDETTYKSLIFVSDYNNSTLKAYDYTATPPLVWNVPSSNIRAYPALADFNNDGYAEVYVENRIYDAATGLLLCSGDDNNKGTAFTIQNPISMPIAIDILGDSRLELVAGNQIYDVNIVSRTNPSLNSMTVMSEVEVPTNCPTDGLTVVADFNNDGKLEVLVREKQVFSDATQNIHLYLWSPHTDPPSVLAHTTEWNKFFGIPFVGDLDADGEVEIVTLSANGTVIQQPGFRARRYNAGSGEFDDLWNIDHFDQSGGTGMTLFDFNQDGKMKIVYRDEKKLRIFDGSTATPTILSEWDCYSETGHEYPVVADILGDGHARILVTCDYDSERKPNGSGGSAFGGIADIKVYTSDGQTSWAPARKVWNQYAYNVLNINEDLTIPQYPMNPATYFPNTIGNNKRPFNNFHQQQTLLDTDGNPYMLYPNLVWETEPTIVIEGDSAIISGCILNDGGAALVSPIYITYYKNDTIYPANFIELQVFDTVIMPNADYCFDLIIKDISSYGDDISSIWLSFNDKEGVYPYQQLCEPNGRFELKVCPVRPIPPTVQGPQMFCEFATVADLIAPENVIWYDEDNNPLTPETQLEHQKVYYASQTTENSYCESFYKTAIMVLITDPSELPPPVIEDQELCEDATVEDIITNAHSGIVIMDEDDNELLPEDELTTGTYKAIYRYGISPDVCESEDTTKFTITITSDPHNNLVIDNQSFCEGATLANIVVPYQNIVWYLTATATQPLPSDTIFGQGEYHLWAAQGFAGKCSEGERIEVIININSSEVPKPVANNSYIFCHPVLLGEIDILGYGTTWYDDEIAGTEIPLTTNITQTTTLWAEVQGNDTCSSSNRIEVEININKPLAPTLESYYPVCVTPNLKLEDILPSVPTNLLWYDAAGNEVILGGFITSDTLLFATQTIGDCESEERTMVFIELFENEVIPAPENFTVTVCPDATVADLETMYPYILFFQNNEGDPLVTLEEGTFYTAYKLASECGEVTYGQVTITFTTGNNGPAIDDQAFCAGVTLGNLMSKYPGIDWFIEVDDLKVALTAADSEMPLTDGMVLYAAFNGSSDCATKDSTEVRIKIGYDLDKPVVKGVTDFCIPVSLAQINIEGYNVVWYKDVALTQEAVVTELIEETTTFYAVSTGFSDCASPALEVTVTINSPLAPTVESYIPVCKDLGIILLGNLVAMYPDNLVWYDKLGNEIVDISDYEITESTFFHVAQKVGNCESGSRTRVYVEIFEDEVIPAPEHFDVTLCESATADDLMLLYPNLVFYTDETGETLLTGDLTDGETYYTAYKFAAACENVNLGTIDVTLTTGNVVPDIDDQTFCDGATLGNLMSKYPGIDWFIDVAGVKESKNEPDFTLTDGMVLFAAFNSLNHCASSNYKEVHIIIDFDTDKPILKGATTFCEPVTLQQINVEGYNIMWYKDEDLEIQADVTELITVTATYYAVSNGYDNCSSEKLPVIVTINRPIAPTLETYYPFCDSSEDIMLSDLLGTLPNNLVWYNNLDAEIDPTTEEITGTTHFYATQTVGGCESVGRTTIFVELFDDEVIPAPEYFEVTLCENATANDLMLMYPTLLFYTDALGKSPLTATDALTEPTYYTAFNSAAACENVNLGTVKVTLTDDNSGPEILAQEFCEGATLGNLMSKYPGIDWFIEDDKGNKEPKNEPDFTLTDGMVLYAAFNSGSTCTGSDSTAVTITIGLNTDEPVLKGATTFCEPVTLQQINVEGYDIIWYEDVALENPADITELIKVTATYYAVSNGYDNCASNGLEVTVTINRPIAPTLETYYPFCDSSDEIMLSDLLETLPNNLVWYDNLDEEIDPTTEKITGTTHFYATQMVGGCESVGRTTIFVELFDDEVIPAPENFDVTLCENATAADLMLMYPTLLFYDVDGETLLDGSETLTEDTYYTAFKSAAACENVNLGTVTVTLTDDNSGPEILAQAFCEGATLGNLMSKYPSIEWFMKDDEDNMIPQTAQLTLTNGMVLYAAFNSGSTCTDSDSTTVTITIGLDTDKPVLKGATTFCEPITLQQINVEGYDIIWYEDETLTTLANTTDLITVTATYYAVSNGYDGCASEGLPVIITINRPIAPTLETYYPFCDSSDDIMLSDLLGTLPNNLVWYNEDNDEINPDTLLITGTTHFYATQTVGGCESVGRTTIFVELFDDEVIPAPEYFEVTLCENATAADLMLMYPTLLFYDVDGETLLDGSETLTEDTYYTAFKSAVACENVNFGTVTVTLTDDNSGPEILAQAFCEGATLGNLMSKYPSIEWFMKDDEDNMIPQTAQLTLTNGMVLYAAFNSGSTCTGSDSTEVHITIGLDTDKPVLKGFTEFCEPVSLQQINVEGYNIKWYKDAALTQEANMTELIKVTTTYYAVSTGYDGCASEGLEVTVSISPVITIGSEFVAAHPHCGTPDGEITFIIEGNGDFEYAVMNVNELLNSTPPTYISYAPIAPDVSVTISGLPAGVYQILARDINYPSCAAAISKDITLRDSGSLHVSAKVIDADDCLSTSKGTVIVEVTGGTPGYSYTPDGNTLLKALLPPTGIIPLSVGPHTIEVEDFNGCKANCGIVFMGGRTSDLDIEVEVTADAHCTVSDGETKVVVHCTSSYSYQLNSGVLKGPIEMKNSLAVGDTIIFTDLPAGIHSIVVFTDCDPEGKTIRFTVNNEVGELWADVTPTNVLYHCDGSHELGSLFIEAGAGNPPYQYRIDHGDWMPFPGTDTEITLTGKTQGVYHIEIMDDNDCTFEVNVVRIDDDLEPPVSIGTIHDGTHPTCDTDDGTILLYLEGGSGEYEYEVYRNYELYSPLATYTTPIISGLEAGTYTIKVNDANYTCAIAVSDDITLYNINTNLRVSVVTTDAADCNSDGKLFIDVTGGTEPFTYKLNGSIIPVPTGAMLELPVGNYILEVTDDDLCTASSEEVWINSETPDVTINTIDITSTACGTAMGVAVFELDGVGDYYYQLHGHEIVGPLTGEHTVVFTGLTAGNYTLYVIGCGKQTEHFTIHNTDPDAFTIKAIPTNVQVFCEGKTEDGFITLSVYGASSNYEYSYDGGATWTAFTSSSVIIPDLKEGSYTIIVRDVNSDCIFINDAVRVEREMNIFLLGTIHVDTHPSCEDVGGSPVTTDGYISFYPFGGSGVYEYRIVLVDGTPVPGFEDFEDYTNPVGPLGVGNYHIEVKDKIHDCGILSAPVVLRNQGSLFKVQLTPINVTNCTDTYGEIEINVKNGTGGPYQYRLNNTGPFINLPFPPVIELLSPGLYTVEVKDLGDACGVTTSGEVRIVARTSTFKAEVLDLLCSPCGEGDGLVRIAIEGEAPYYYELDYEIAVLVTTNQDTITLSGLEAGTHLLRVFGDCGESGVGFEIENCDITDGLYVEAEGFDVDEFLSGDVVTAQIHLRIFGGTHPYQYTIDGWETWEETTGPDHTVLQVIEGLLEGTYKLEVRDAAGCTYETNVIIAVYIETGKLISCPSLFDRYPYEDAPGAGYTHLGDEWDLLYDLMMGLDSVQYVVDGVIYSHGKPASLDGYIFPLGTSNVMVVAFYQAITDTCYFDVNVIKGCYPIEIGTIAVDRHPACGICDGQIIFHVQGGNGSYEYRINNEDPWIYYENPLVTGLCAGTFTISVRDSLFKDDCPGAVSPPIVLSSSDIMVNVVPYQASGCDQNDGSIEVTVTGGNYPYTYQLEKFTTVWAPQGSPTLIPLNTTLIESLLPGLYRVKITDHRGCIAYSEEVRITADSDLEIEFLKDIPATCNTATGELWFTVESSLQYGYIFRSIEEGMFTVGDSGIDTVKLAGLSAGTYTVTVFTSCDLKTLTLTVTNGSDQLFVTASSTNLKFYCESEIEKGEITLTVTDGASPYQYTYDNGITWSAPFTGPNEVIPNLNEGVYYVIVKDDDDCTFAMDEIKIGVEKMTSVVIGSQYVDTHPDCGISNGKIQFYIEGEGEYEYTLYNIAHSSPLIPVTTYTDGLITDLPAGDYIIYVWDKNHPTCDTAISGILTLNSGMFAIDIEPKEIPTCGNTDGAVYVKVTGGNGNYTYLLDDISPSTTGFITGLTAGTHTITVTENGTNCSVSKEFFLNASNPDVAVNVVSVTETPCGENAGIAVLTMTSTGSGVYTYQLDYETIGHNTGNQSILLDNLSAGLHVFTITGQCGSDSVQFIIENSDSDLAFTATPHDVRIYCNEIELGYIVLEITGNATAYTIDGWETWETITGTPVTIPNLTEGIYKIEIMDEDDCIFEVNDVRINRTSHDPLLIGSHYVDKHPDCGDTNGQIQFYVEGGSGEYEYMLFNTSHSSPLISATTYTDGLITGLPAGDYIIYVWDTNHSDCDTAISGVLTLSSGMFAVEVETGIEPSCGTTNGTIYVKVTGGSGAFTYMVDGIPATPATSGLITGISAGAHTITVTEDGNNCSVTQDFFLNASDSNISISVRTVEPALCDVSAGKATIVMNGTEYTYQLDYETIGNNAGSNIITLDNLSAGLHVVHITGECGKDSVVFIIENSNSDLAFTATPHDVLVSCNDLVLGYIEIEVNGGTPNYTYTMDGWITSTEMTGGVILATIPNLTEGIYKIEITDEDGCSFEVNDIRINRSTEKPIAFGTIQVITEPDCNTSTGEIQFYLSGGSGNYEYDVYKNSVLLLADQEYSSTAGLITGLTVGNYTIYVRDKSNNCTAAVSDEIVLSNKGTNLTLTVIPNEVSNCMSSNGVLFISAAGGTAPYTYTLNGVSTSLVNGEITGLTAGEYVVEVTDDDGCVANSGKVRIYSTSSGLTITELEHEDAICGKATGMVSFEVNGNEPYEYQFDYGDIYPVTGNNTLIFSGLPAGEHILRIFNDCGEVEENINITNGDNSLAFNVAVENVKVFCDGEVENGNITLSVKDGATPYQYRIDGGDWIPFTPTTATTYTIPNITVGTYKIEVMDNTGCVYEYNSVKVIRETVEPVSIRSAYVKTEPDCGTTNGAIQFFVQGGSGNYQYSLNGGAFLPYPSDGIISNLLAGTYYIEVIDVSHETCAPAVSQAITLNSTSTNLKLTVTAEDASSCSSDGSLEITVKGGTSPYAYSLNGTPYALIMPVGSTTMSFTRPVGAYTVDVRDAYGCITGSGEIRITSPDSEYSVNVIDSIGTTCGNAEGIVIFEVTGNEIPYYYQLNGFAPVPVYNLSETITLTGLPAGNHFLKVYGNCGADSTRFNIVNGTGSPSDLSFTAIVNNDMVEFPLGGISYGDITITITGGTPSYQYRIDKGTWLPVSGSTHNITGLTNGIYYIEVKDANGCYYELNIEVLRILGIDKLLDCSIVIDRAVEEDDYGACHYTHIGDEWDMIIIPGELDSVRYIINDVIYSSGADASLNGAIFPVGVSQVLVIGYLGDRTDTCEFTVTVDRICPSSTTDIEEHDYTVSKVAGLCWTSNLRATVYDDGITAINFAKPYYSPENADIAYNDSIFGLLYTWYSAVGVPEGSTDLPVTDEYGYVQGICPAGWHVPSQEEWNKLEAYNAKQLQSTLYWLDPPGAGTDDFGFDARPAGWFNGLTNRYEDMYGFAGWWASDANNSGTTASYFWIAYYCSQIQNNTKNKTDGLSVRCILDYCGIDY